MRLMGTDCVFPRCITAGVPQIPDPSLDPTWIQTRRFITSARGQSRRGGSRGGAGNTGGSQGVVSSLEIDDRGSDNEDDDEGVEGASDASDVDDEAAQSSGKGRVPGGRGKAGSGDPSSSAARQQQRRAALITSPTKKAPSVDAPGSCSSATADTSSPTAAGGPATVAIAEDLLLEAGGEGICKVPPELAELPEVIWER